MKILTRYDPKPIPLRSADWVAVLEGYDEGDPIGYGDSEQNAINALLERLEDKKDD